MDTQSISPYLDTVDQIRQNKCIRAVVVKYVFTLQIIPTPLAMFEFI